LLLKLPDLNQNYKTTIAWVKGHDGLEGNERADKMAKVASKDSRLRTSYNDFPVSFLQNYLRQKSMDVWNNSWTTTQKGAQTKKFFQTINSRFKTKIELTGNLTMALSGHGKKTKEYLHRFRILNSPVCPCNWTSTQSIDHILFDCKKIDDLRKYYIFYCKKKGVAEFSRHKEILISKCSRTFIKFVNALPFQDL